MQIVAQSWEFEPGCPGGDDVLKRIERAGRTCYKSEDKITPESAKEFVLGIIQRGHEREATIQFMRWTCKRFI